jgi:hypothetical protein
MFKKVTEENFIALDPKILLDTKQYQDVEDMVFSIAATNSSDYAQKYSQSLADKLASLAESMDKILMSKYLRLLRTLQLCALLNVKDSDKEQFFREQITDVFYLNGFNVHDCVEELFKTYFKSQDIIQSMRKLVLTGLESNNERIGQSRISIGGQASQIVNPTVQNWIKDYNISTKINFEKKSRSSLEQVTYFNQSANIRTLKPEEKTVLMAVFKLYDWVRFNNFNYDFSVPGQKKEEDVMLPEEKHDLLDPEIIDLINKKYRNNLVVPKPASIAKSKNVSTDDEYLKLAGISTSAPRSFEEKIESLNKKPLDAKKGVELEKFLSKVQAQKTVSTPQVVQKQAIKMTPEEIKREVTAEELPAHTSEPPKQHVGTAGLEIKNIPPVRMDMKKISSDLEPKFSVSGIVNLPTMRPMPRMAPILSKLPTAPKAAPRPVKILPLTSVSNISAIDDFKKIDVSLLRQGSSASNIELIKEKIISVARDQRSFPALAVQAFEQSPLFKLYLNLGAEMLLDRSDNRDIAYTNASKKLSAGGTPVLTLQEFEMVADLKKEIERL